MYKNKRILAIVPARGGSKGLHDKNIIMINGKPLIAWSIVEGKKSKYIDRLIVSTDSKKIAKVAKEFGAEIPFMRPAELATDTASSIDVILHAINFFESKGEKYDYLVLLEPTSPLRTVEDIDTPLKILIDHPKAKAIEGLMKTESDHPDFTLILNKEGMISPFMGGERLIVKRRQDLKNVYYPEGTVHISEIETLKKEKTLFHELTLGYPVDRYKYFEVDEEMDLVIMEALLKFREKGGFDKVPTKKIEAGKKKRDINNAYGDSEESVKRNEEKSKKIGDTEK